jgi:uncharacterized protein (DUF427 family)
VESVPDRIRVVVDGLVLADSTSALRVLETNMSVLLWRDSPGG